MRVAVVVTFKLRCTRMRRLTMSRYFRPGFELKVGEAVEYRVHGLYDSVYMTGKIVGEEGRFWVVKPTKSKSHVSTLTWTLFDKKTLKRYGASKDERRYSLEPYVKDPPTIPVSALNREEEDDGTYLYVDDSKDPWMVKLVGVEVVCDDIDEEEDDNGMIVEDCEEGGTPILAQKWYPVYYENTLFQREGELASYANDYELMPAGSGIEWCAKYGISIIITSEMANYICLRL